MENPIAMKDRVVNPDYTNVVFLSSKQLASHCAHPDSTKAGLSNVRVTMEGDKESPTVTAESTDGKILIRVSEKAPKLLNLPVKVNPSERINYSIDEEILIPAHLCSSAAKQSPQRKSFRSELWQRGATFSFTPTKVEAVFPNKQGKEVVKETPIPTTNAFPPTDKVWHETPPTVSAKFDIKRLLQLLNAIDAAEVPVVSLSLRGSSLSMEVTGKSVGYGTEVRSLIMPMTE